MSRRAWLLAGLGLLGGCAAFAVPILMFMVVLGASSEYDEICQPTSDDVMLAADSEETALNADQLENAATVIAVGNRMGVPRHGLVIALAVASQESGFLNFA